jgi:hypothetical protein
MFYVSCLKIKMAKTLSGSSAKPSVATRFSQKKKKNAHSRRAPARKKLFFKEKKESLQPHGIGAEKS